MNEKEPKKIAVYFPGVGYTVDKPLLYYSRKLTEKDGYENLLISYGSMPKKTPGSTEKIPEMFTLASEQSLHMLKAADFSAYEEVLFIGKSIGTVIAAKIASESPEKERIRLIHYTPLEETFSYNHNAAIVFTGTNDPWTGKEKSRITELCKSRRIPCHLIPEGNHSLESGNVFVDLENLQSIMKITETFIQNQMFSEKMMGQ